MPVRRPLSAINPQIAPRVASKETLPAPGLFGGRSAAPFLISARWSTFSNSHRRIQTKEMTDEQ